MKTVLVVDDTPSILTFVTTLLESSGFLVISAGNGEEALAKARCSPPDVLISDLLMPVMDGYTLLRHWKSDVRLKEIPFIVFSATYTEESDENLALRLGADAFVLKSIEPVQLVSRLREVLARVEHANPAKPEPNVADETSFLKKYSVVLVHKLEQKTHQLEQTNQVLQRDIAERRLVEEQLRFQSEELRALSARVQTAREEEATRIARELHDELGSSLTGLKWVLSELHHALSSAQDDPEGIAAAAPDAIQRLEAAIQYVDQTTVNVKRIASELRPSILDDLGLPDAIESQLNQFAAASGIQCHFEANLDAVDLNPDQSTAVFRICQEALTNILRHAHAERIDVEMSEQCGEFVLTICDDGIGIPDEAGVPGRSLGLLGMRERARLAGGKVSVTRGERGGTVVAVRIPLRCRRAAAF